MRKQATKQITAALAAQPGSGATPITVAPVASAKPKRAEKPLPLVSPSGKPVEAAKPVDAVAPIVASDAAKPTKQAERAEAASERATALAAHRDAVALLYGGPSPVFHAKRATKAGDILARVAMPIQRIATAPTVRDSSLAAVLAKLPDASDILATLCIGADAGAVSRLASVGCLTTDGKAVTTDQAKLKRVASGSMPL